MNSLNAISTLLSRKGEWAIRPVHHQRDERIEAHIFVSFLAYWWHATLRNLARRPAGGLSPRAILEKLSAMQMIDEHLPTTGGKHIVLSRYTEPEADAGLLLAQLQIPLPAQSPPKADAPGKMAVECRPKENKHCKQKGNRSLFALNAESRVSWQLDRVGRANYHAGLIRVMTVQSAFEAGRNGI